MGRKESSLFCENDRYAMSNLMSNAQYQDFAA